MNMKRLIKLIFIVIVMTIAIPLNASPPPEPSLEFIREILGFPAQAQNFPIGIASYTVGTLPASSSTGTLVAVTDAATLGSCTVGSGTNNALCRWSGSAWKPIGDGGGTGGLGTVVVVEGSTYAKTDVGLNAAITAACASPGGRVIATPGSYTIAAQVVVNCSDIEISGYGAILTCNVANDCISIDTAGNTFANVTFHGFTIKPGTGSGGTGVGDGFAGIKDNLNTGGKIEDISFRANGTNRFDHGIALYTDEAANIKGITFNAQVIITCTATFCGSGIYNPTGQAAVGWVSKSNLSMGCSGNGIIWQGGNNLRVEDTVIQGYNQFADLFTADTSTQLVAFEENNVYTEVGACTNPFGNIGFAAHIIQGGRFINHSGAGFGAMPQFVQNGATGSTIYQYWVVPINGANKGVPLAAGYLTNGNATLSAGNNVSVVWPKISTATTYDLLRLTVAGGGDQQAPNGNANQAVTVAYTQATCGTNICAFTDTVPTGSLTNYTVTTNQNYNPFLTFWPGSTVLTVNATSNEGNAAFQAIYEGRPGEGPDISTANTNTALPTVHYESGYLFTGAGVGGNNNPYSPIADSSSGMFCGGCGNNYNPAWLFPNQTAQGTMPANKKGLINIGNAFPGFTNSDLITLIDNGFYATMATMSHRPVSDTNDMAICEDNSGAGLCFRAATSISNYINVNPDNAAFTERLTSALKSFTVPVKATGFQLTNSFESGTLPTIAAAGCGGTNSTISAANGTASFEILVGSGGATAAGCTVTMPAATTSWTCDANTVSATSTTNFLVKQTGAISTTSVTIQNFSDVGAATAFGASDTIRVKCAAN